jgi:hypothetical protein
MNNIDPYNFTVPTAKVKALGKRITPRFFRLLKALVEGPITREQADRIAGASNSPDYIRRLKKQFGLEIRTERVNKLDRDGRHTRIGVYHLEGDSVQLARILLTIARFARQNERVPS